MKKMIISTCSILVLSSFVPLAGAKDAHAMSGFDWGFSSPSMSFNGYAGDYFENYNYNYNLNWGQNNFSNYYNNDCTANNSAYNENDTAPNPTQGTAPTQDPSSNAPSDAVKTAEQALEIVNANRAKEGLAPYALDLELLRFATFKAADLTQNNYFAHTSPVYGSPWELADKLGIDSILGEIIAKTGDKNVSAPIEMWMNSPGHHAILMSKEYTHIAIANDGQNWVGAAGIA